MGKVTVIDSKSGLDIRNFERSGLYTSREGAINGAFYWADRGYIVVVKKVSGGWKHYRKMG